MKTTVSFAIALSIVFLLNFPSTNCAGGGLIDEVQTCLEANLNSINGYHYIMPQPGTYPIPYCWDTYFSVIAVVKFNPGLAKECINAELSVQQPNGMLPNAPSSVADQDLRSQAPLLADGIVSYYEKTRDLDSLRIWFPKIEAYYNWYDTYGDINNTNMIAPLTGRRILDRYTVLYIASSSMDNHPIYDCTNGRYSHIGDYYYLPINDVLLSSCQALFAKDMSLIAGILGNQTAQQYYANEYSLISSAINSNLWDQDSGLYKAQLWNGRKINISSVQTFAPLIANISTPQQAQQLVQHLKNTDEFNTTYGIPTIAKNDPTYYSKPPQCIAYSPYLYWRGGIWAPTTYLVYKGLMNYGYTDLASTIAQQWISLVTANNPTCAFAEFYDTETGTPGITYLPNVAWTAAVTGMFL